MIRVRAAALSLVSQSYPKASFYLWDNLLFPAKCSPSAGEVIGTRTQLPSYPASTVDVESNHHSPSRLGSNQRPPVQNDRSSTADVLDDTEREGFEPPVPIARYTRFPSARHRPLGHLSISSFLASRRCRFRVGFHGVPAHFCEWPSGLSPNFPKRLL